MKRFLIIVAAILLIIITFGLCFEGYLPFKRGIKRISFGGSSDSAFFVSIIDYDFDKRGEETVTIEFSNRVESRFVFSPENIDVERMRRGEWKTVKRLRKFEYGKEDEITIGEMETLEITLPLEAFNMNSNDLYRVSISFPDSGSCVVPSYIFYIDVFYIPINTYKAVD